MKKNLTPLQTFGLSLVFYAIAVIVGYDSFIGSAFALVGLLLLVFAIVGGVSKLIKKS